MNEPTNFLFFLLTLAIMPPLALGVIRKIKARLQNRVGPPVLQPIFDLCKLFSKDETVSETASWVFRFAPVFNVGVALYLATIVPWLTPKPYFGNGDLFVVLYLLAAMRFFILLASLDTGSAFGAFAASREATLSFLVEPAAILCLTALAVVNHSSDLNVVFDLSTTSHTPSVLWLLSGGGFLLASLVDLSRMPLDDPTTHLELTMVHEALIIEASGRNLALWEYATMLKLSILFGLCAQCYMRAVPQTYELQPIALAVLSIVGIILVACAVGVFESIAVKLRWTKAPEFIAYAVSLSFIACLVALGVGSI